MANLLNEQSPPESAKESQQKLAQLITYLLNNLERIRYGTFPKQGYWIGSGAMEAAHRTLVQHPLKRSGQRWTPIGALKVVNLPAAYQSALWNLITQRTQRILAA